VEHQSKLANFYISIVHSLTMHQIKFNGGYLTSHDDNIQKKICSNDFKLSKGNKCNYVHY